MIEKKRERKVRCPKNLMTVSDEQRVYRNEIT